MALLAMALQEFLSATSGGDRAVGRVRLFAWPLVVVLLVSHLVAAPFLGLWFVDNQAATNSRLLRALDSVPDDPALAEQTLILLNPPDSVYTVIGVLVRKLLQGHPPPRRLRALAHGGSAIEVQRVDDRTLELDLERGLFPDAFSRYFGAEPFTVGDQVELADLTVEIVALDPRGDPSRLEVRFDRSLEDPSLRWLRWADGIYVDWRPPAIGGRDRLDAVDGIFVASEP